MQGVKERIKATFVSLIPDDQWEAMVKKEIDDFFVGSVTVRLEERTSKPNYWAQKDILVKETVTNPFRAIVWSMCASKTTELLKAKLINEHFDNAWPQKELNDKMKEVVAAAIPIAVTNFFNQFALMTAENIRQQIQQMR